DGKVRFLAEDIADKDFLAMCTIAGGENVDVDSVAPEVAAGKVKVELKPQALPPTSPAPKPEKKPEPTAEALPLGWKELTSAEPGFSVLLPGTPREEKPPAVAGLTVQSFILEFQKDVGCGVMITELPKPIAPNQIEQQLAAMRRFVELQPEMKIRVE